ncbi:MAG: hypothetical protein AAGH68_07160 [Pseudomonadota bacterium]
MTILRKALSVSVLACCVTPASAEEMDIAQSWEHFTTTCGQMLSDPDAYLANLPEKGSKGQKLTSTAADDSFQVAEYQNGPVNEQMHLAHFEGYSWVTCHIQINSVSVKGVDAQEAALREVLSEAENVVLAGGKVERNYTSLYAGLLEVANAEIVQFTAVGVFDNPELHAEGELDGEGFYANVEGRVTPSE